jgi:hypothetical protein
MLSYFKCARVGVRSSANIKAVLVGGYDVARGLFDVCGDGRTAHGLARRALRNASKLADARPYYIEDGMLFALWWWDSLERGEPVYLAMRGTKSKTN